MSEWLPTLPGWGTYALTSSVDFGRQQRMWKAMPNLSRADRSVWNQAGVLCINPSQKQKTRTEQVTRSSPKERVKRDVNMLRAKDTAGVPHTNVLSRRLPRSKGISTPHGLCLSHWPRDSPVPPGQLVSRLVRQVSNGLMYTTGRSRDSRLFCVKCPQSGRYTWGAFASGCFGSDSILSVE